MVDAEDLLLALLPACLSSDRKYGSGRQSGCLYFANFYISAIPTITNLEYILQKLSNSGWINIDK